MNALADKVHKQSAIQHPYIKYFHKKNSERNLADVGMVQ